MIQSKVIADAETKRVLLTSPEGVLTLDHVRSGAFWSFRKARFWPANDIDKLTEPDVYEVWTDYWSGGAP